MSTPEQAIKAATLEWLFGQLGDLKRDTERLITKVRNHPDKAGLEEEISGLEKKLESFKNKLEFEKRTP